jgi:hypothetical protein
LINVFYFKGTKKQKENTRPTPIQENREDQSERRKPRVVDENKAAEQSKSKVRVILHDESVASAREKRSETGGLTMQRKQHPR